MTSTKIEQSYTGITTFREALTRKVMALKVFFDSFSQPSRAVLLLMHANKIVYEKCVINIAKGKDIL